MEQNFRQNKQKGQKKNKKFAAAEPESDLSDIKKMNYLLQCANIVDSPELARFYAHNSTLLAKRQQIRSYAIHE
jgi:hypothetical protein